MPKLKYLLLLLINGDALTENEENLAVTRVTVPIDYKSPSLNIISTFKKEWAAKGMTQKEIDEKLASFNEDWKTKKNAMVICFLANDLVGHSAQKIYLVDLGNLTDLVMSKIPSYLKYRIEWADRDKKIQKQISEMLEPIHEDIDPIWEKIRKQNGASSYSLNGHEHGICLLHEFLTTLTIALKYETEADADFDVVQTALSRIRKQISSPVALSLVSRIDGLLNCYQNSTQVPYVYPRDSNATHDLLKNLLDDARMISLSKSRHLLGIPSKFETAIIKVKQKTRLLASIPKNRKHFAMATKIGNMATKQLNVELPQIDVERKEEFAPPLVSLNKFKPLCLATRRRFSEETPT